MNTTSWGLRSKPWPVATLAGLLAVCSAFSILSRVPGAEFLDAPHSLVPVVFCATALWFIMLPLSRRLLGWACALSTRIRVIAIACALVTGTILLFALPISPAPNSVATVSVSVLDGKSESSQGREVWLRLERDGKDVPFSDLRQSGKWVDKAPFLVAVDPSVPTSIAWRGSYADSLRLIFVSHAWSGRARVTWNGMQRNLDLYRPEGGSLTLDLGGLEITQSRLSIPDRSLRQWATAIADIILMGALGLWLFGWLAARPDPSMEVATSDPAWREALLYSLPLFASGVACLIIFYPGMMTSDSLDQWRQSGSLSFNDAHPLLYGLMMVAARWLWDSPAAVATVQLVLLSTSSGWLVASVRRATGAPTLLAWFSACLLAVFPLLPMTAVTLWKDVPYSAAVIALTAFVVARLPRRATDEMSVGAAIALALLMFCAMALRHNGPPVAFAAALVLFFIARRARLRVALAVMAAIMMMVLLKGPISDAVGIERKPVSYVLYSHHIAAHLATKHLPSSAADQALLREINATDADWAYNCATVNPTVFNPHFDARLAMAHNSDLLRILLELARNRPDIEFQHGMCSSGLIWRIKDYDHDPLYLSSVGLWAPHGKVNWISGERGDPVQDSMSPALAEFVGKLALLPGMEAVFRPAIYMYMLIFACGVAFARLSDRRIWLLLVLPAVHTAFLAISIVAQDARYQLPLYGISLIAVPLLVAARRGQRQLSGQAGS